MTSAALPCPFLVGDQLCSKPRGHRWRHKADLTVLEISGRRLGRIRASFFGRAWWQRRPRCPRCRVIIESLSLGEPIGPVLTVVGDSGPCVEVVSQFPVWFGPCGHQFRRVIRPGDFR